MSVIDRAMRLSRDEGGVTVKHVPTPKFHANEIHNGPIHSSVAGRTDHLPMRVLSGSYILPADCVSGAPGAEGNTMAGFAHARRVFGGMPRGQGNSPYGQSHGPYGMMAKGGKTDSKGNSVPIVAAGGEYVIHPDQVREIGGGDLDMGHRVLDEFVKRVRKDLIKTLKKLPGPKKD